MTSLAPPDIAFTSYQYAVRRSFPYANMDDNLVYLLDELTTTCGSLSSKLSPEIPAKDRPPFVEVSKDIGYMLRCLSALSDSMGIHFSDVAEADIESVYRKDKSHEKPST